MTPGPGVAVQVSILRCWAGAWPAMCRALGSACPGSAGEPSWSPGRGDRDAGKERQGAWEESRDHEGWGEGLLPVVWEVVRSAWPCGEMEGSTGQTQPTVYRAPASLVCVKRSWGSRLLQSDLRGKLLPPGSQASLRIIRLSTAQMVRNPPAMRETWVPSLGWEDLLEKGMVTHSSILT